MATKTGQDKALGEVFDRIDVDGSGTLDCGELRKALQAVKLKASTVDDILREANATETINREQFMKAMAVIGGKSSDSALQQLVKRQAELLQVSGKGGAVHSYSTEEVYAFAGHLNHVLGDDPQLAHLMPINQNSNDLFDKLKDGIVLAKFVNCIKPDTIDERVLNLPKKGKPLSVFKTGENLNLAINSCKGIGVKVVAIGANDIRDAKNPVLALGLLWQMVKMHLLHNINLKAHPELIRLLKDGETLEELLALSSEQILMRWMNYHLAEAGTNRRIRNFGPDVKDSEAYTIVMNRISPNHCDLSALNTQNKGARAQKVLQNAKSIGCNPFIKPKDITSGNNKLNLAFTADLFNTCPGLDPVEEEELNKLGMIEDDAGDSREERAFRLWANTLGIQDFYLNNLFDDFSDGLNMLKTIEAVEPGTVVWRQVEKKPKLIFKKNANNSYAVVLGKGAPFKFSLVGIGGSDITQKNKKLVLAFVWQLFRYHSVKFVKELATGIDDIEKYILKWANEQVKSFGGSRISSFKDKSLETGVFYCQLVKSIESKVVDDELITGGTNEEDGLLNCRYAISVARQQDTCIFCLPEDLREVKPKMVLTFFAAIMKRANRGKVTGTGSTEEKTSG